MTTQAAIDLIKSGITDTNGIWADIGAGTGTFTIALREILSSGTIYAVDKNPHVLWSLKGTDEVQIVVEEADFTHPMDLPYLDGIVMANALHYAEKPIPVITNIIELLKPGGVFILVEYETERRVSRWVPYPIPFEKFKTIAQAIGLSEPREIGKVPSQYGYEYIYAAVVIAS